MHQLSLLLKDISSLLGKNKYRVILILFNRAFYGILSYRIDRSFFLIFGSFYKYIRILLSPFFFLMQILSNCDIHYKANIKGGINIHHPSLGIVISGKAIIGEKITLNGGNVIGIKNNKFNSNIIIGDNCNLGANSCVIGPLKLGDSIKIGAMACVTNDFTNSNAILIGIPAKLKTV